MWNTSQVTTQLLFIQWLDNFQAHARMALPPADFVVCTKRHEGLLAALFGSTEGLGVGLFYKDK